jgi:hypothetical protein
VFVNDNEMVAQALLSESGEIKDVRALAVLAVLGLCCRD